MTRGLSHLFGLFLMGCFGIFPACSKKTSTGSSASLKRVDGPTLVNKEGVRLDATAIKQRVTSLCERMNKQFEKFNWKEISCQPDAWKTGGLSVNGDPLLYGEFGDLSPDARTTLVFCGVHGDEPTSIYMCFSLIQSQSFKEIQQIKGRRVAVAPMVNPDGFFAKPATRTNANGIDLNRNFSTKDWHEKAVGEWKRKYKKDKRKFPGINPNSEPETLFQVWLMDTFKPDKILTAHAPLKFIDYDGPADRKHYTLERREHRARYLAMNISKNSRFPLVDYQFFPGSLGNYAGQEAGIPTYTLELPSSAPETAKKSWDRFEYSLIKAIRFDVTDEISSVTTRLED